MSSASPTQIQPPNNQALRKKAFTAVFFTILLDLVGFGLFIPIVTPLARRLGAADSTAAMVASIYSLGTLLATAFVGRLSDRMGRRKIITLTIALSALAQALTGFSELFGFTWLIAIRFLAGIAAGNISVVQASIADITKPSERGPSMAIIGISFGLGFALGPAIGGAITHFTPDAWHLKAIAGVAALLNILNLVFVIRHLPETHPRYADPLVKPLVDEAQSETVARQAGKPTETGLQKNSWRQDLTLLLSQKSFRVILLMGFLQTFGFVGVETILSFVMMDDFGIRDQKAIFNAFIFIGTMVLLANAALSRRVMRRIGEANTLNIGQLLLGGAMFAVPLVAPSVPLMYTCLLAVACGSALANPSISGLTSRLAPQEIQGFAMGTSQTLGALARITGPAVMGFLYERLNGSRSLMVSAALMLVGLVVSVVGLSSEARQKPNGGSPSAPSPAA